MNIILQILLFTLVLSFGFENTLEARKRRRHPRIKSPRVKLEDPLVLSVGLGLGGMSNGINAQYLYSSKISVVGYGNILGGLVLGGEAHYTFLLEENSSFQRAGLEASPSYSSFAGKVSPYIGGGMMIMPGVSVYGLGGAQYVLEDNPLVLFGHINLALSGFGASATIGARYIL